MSDRYNGGISVKIGSYQLKKIAAYVPSWEIVKDTFTAYDYRTVSVYRGRRFKLSVTTGYLTPEELSDLQTALFAHSFTVTTPDFTTEKKTAFKIVTLAASPSRPSVKLTPLTVPRITKARNGIVKIPASSSLPGRNGMRIRREIPEKRAKYHRKTAVITACSAIFCFGYSPSLRCSTTFR